MNPELAVAVGRDHESWYRRTLHPGMIRADEDRVATTDDAQHLQCQRWHDCALRLHHDRHAPDNAVAFGADCKEPAAAGGLLEGGHITQQAGKIEQEGPRIAAHCRYADWLLGAAGFRHREGETRFADHDARFAEGISERRIIARQRTQLCPCRFVKIAE